MAEKKEVGPKPLSINDPPKPRADWYFGGIGHDDKYAQNSLGENIPNYELAKSVARLAGKRLLNAMRKFSKAYQRSVEIESDYMNECYKLQEHGNKALKEDNDRFTREMVHDEWLYMVDARAKVTNLSIDVMNRHKRSLAYLCAEATAAVSAAMFAISKDGRGESRTESFYNELRMNVFNIMMLTNQNISELYRFMKTCENVATVAAKVMMKTGSISQEDAAARAWLDNEENFLRELHLLRCRQLGEKKAKFELKTWHDTRFRNATANEAY